MITVIKAGRIFQATGHPPILGGVVVVEGDRITAVGIDGELSFPEIGGATTIQAEDSTVLPGLIDSHVHLWWGRGREHRDDWDEVVAASTIRALVLLEKVAREGITAIRDCGYPHHGVFALRRAIERGDVLGPRLLLCGRAISATGGHAPSISVQVDGADEVRKAVRREMKAGADWIKLMVTGGTSTPGERTDDVQLTIEEMKAAVEEAQRRGKKICAHVACLEGAKSATVAGVHSLEHGVELDDAMAEQMVQMGIFLVPTMLSPKVEALSSAESGIPEFVRRKALKNVEKKHQSFRTALSSGVRIAAGTDAGAPHLPIGRDSLVAELKTMVEHGLEPAAAVESATRVAAEMLGLDSDLGTVEAGKLANLNLVRGDPTVNIEDLNNLRSVMRDGVLMEPPD